MDEVKSFLEKHDKPSSTEVCSEVGQAVTQETVTGHVHQENATAVDLERHIHHHQHRVQPIADLVHEPERHESTIAPERTTETVKEMTPEQRQIIDGQRSQHRDTRTEGPTEFTRSSLGETVNESVFHHVHEHITPVIQREIHTHKIVTNIIPIHEVVHDAPIIHETTVLPSISLADFEKRYQTVSQQTTGGMKGERKTVDGNMREETREERGVRSSASQAV